MLSVLSLASRAHQTWPKTGSHRDDDARGFIPAPRAAGDNNRFSSNSEYTSHAVQAVTGKTCIYTHDNNVGSHSPHTAAVEMRNHRISLERFPSLRWSCPRSWFPALP